MFRVGGPQVVIVDEIIFMWTEVIHLLCSIVMNVGVWGLCLRVDVVVFW